MRLYGTIKRIWRRLPCLMGHDWQRGPELSGPGELWLSWTLWSCRRPRCAEVKVTPWTGPRHVNCRCTVVPFAKPTARARRFAKRQRDMVGIMDEAMHLPRKTKRARAKMRRAIPVLDSSYTRNMAEYISDQLKGHGRLGG